MKNPLNKRIFREFKHDAGKYIVLFLFLTLTIGFVSGFLVAGGSMKTAYDESFEKYDIEDGHFTSAAEIPQSTLDDIEREEISVYPLFYKNVTLRNNHVVRVYENRNDIDRICLMEGNFPEKDDEIVVDRLYAENNEMSVGDIIEIEEKKFIISGFVSFSDYSALFKNNTDMMFDANKFTVACVTEKAFIEISNINLKYNYAWRNIDRSLSEKQKSDKADNIKEILSETEPLTDFVKAGDNQAIIFTGDDMGGDRIIMITLLYIVIVVLAFVFGITTRNTIEKEAGAIGTLRASGFTKKEIICHYMLLPIIIMIIAAAAGNILGYTVMKEIFVAMYYHSYSLPTYITLWNADAFILTTFIPCLIVFIVVISVLISSLRLSPLQFLRHELTVKKKKKVIKLKHFSFITRFRLRIIFQNMTSYFTLFIGVVFAGVLLLFGMMMSPLLENFRSEVINSKIADYQYILKAPVETENKYAERYSVCSLETESGEEITVYGVDKNSKYLKNINLDNNTVLLSDGFIEKYEIKPNEEFELFQKYDDKSYIFTANGSYNYPAALSIFMSREKFNEIFEKDENYFCGYFSDEKISDIDENYIATVITQSDLTIVADQLEDSMGQMFLLMCGFSVLMYILLVYLLSKQVTEKNVQSVSMIKILGYSNKEISKLYNITTGIVMIISLLLSLPASYYFIKIIYYAMMKDFNGWLTFYVAPWIYPAMLAVGVLCYFAVHLIQTERLNKVSMSTALKNIE